MRLHCCVGGPPTSPCRYCVPPSPGSTAAFPAHPPRRFQPRRACLEDVVSLTLNERARYDEARPNGQGWHVKKLGRKGR